jgi:hypothetical protein
VTLAMSASVGVYEFSRLFMSHWAAMITAASFELTYIGLACLPAQTFLKYMYARKISMGAVVVSVLYNSISGFLNRNVHWSKELDIKQGPGIEQLLKNDSLFMWEILLAVLHGAPLAIIAYLVSDFLLHPEYVAYKENEQETPKQSKAKQEPNPVPGAKRIVPVRNAEHESEKEGFFLNPEPHVPSKPVPVYFSADGGTLDDKDNDNFTSVNNEPDLSYFAAQTQTATATRAEPETEIGSPIALSDRPSAQERKEAIRAILKSDITPPTANVLASRFKVSEAQIRQDLAIVRRELGIKPKQGQ